MVIVWPRALIPLVPFDKLRACPVLDTGASGIRFSTVSNKLPNSVSNKYPDSL